MESRSWKRTSDPDPAVSPDPEQVSIREVQKAYGETEILRGVSLDVSRGEVVVIIGASGSGKTTLLRCVAGLEPIQGGRIDVFGTRVPRRLAPARRGRLRLSALQPVPADDRQRERDARAREGAQAEALRGA